MTWSTTRSRSDSSRRRSRRADLRQVLENAERAEVGAQLRTVDEPDADEPDGFGGLDVRDLVIDEDGLAGLEPVALKQDVEDPGIRLDQSLFARDHDPVEPFEKRIPRPGDRKRL